MRISLRTLLVAAGLFSVIFALPGAAVAQRAPQVAAAPVSQPEFVYRFRARDTLIHVCRRLLLQPQRWPDVQRRNGIRDPFNIPPETAVRIPYSWLRLTPQTAIVQAVSGTVTRDGTPLAQGDVLAQGALIETAANGSVSLLFSDRSVVTVQKSSVLRLVGMHRVEGASDGHGVELRLESGRVESTVEPKRDVGRFEIVTPVAVSAVRGTRFRSAFDRDAASATSETLEGAVGVAGAQGAATVGAGFGTRVDPGGAVLAPVPLLPMPDLSTVPTVHANPRLRLDLSPVPGAVSYRLQLAGDAQFRAVLLDEASTAPAFDLAMPADGEYWLRVRGVDALGLEGNDAIRQFTQHLLPGSPELQSPETGARLHGDDIVVQWSELPQDGRYRVQLARDGEFTDVLTDRQIEGATRMPLEPLAPGTYYWRVAGRNSRGEQGAWSPAHTFTRPTPAPAVEVTRADRRELRLSWATQTGDSYRLQLARDASFERPTVDQVMTQGEYVLGKPPAGTYYARVQVLSPGGAVDPFGEPRRVEIPIPGWLKLLLSSSVLVPVLL